jgi:hypothetical protein
VKANLASGLTLGEFQKLVRTFKNKSFVISSCFASFHVFFMVSFCFAFLFLNWSAHQVAFKSNRNIHDEFETFQLTRKPISMFLAFIFDAFVLSAALSLWILAFCMGGIGAQA